jgi:hypothetical protein
LAIIPYTGPLLGYFVSARALNRVAWFAPLGIGLVVIGKTVLELIQTRVRVNTPQSESIVKNIYSRIPLWGFALLLIFGLGSPTMVDVVRSLPDLASLLSFHRQLGQVGAFISSNNPEPVTIFTLNETDDYLPGISASANPITHRERDLTKGHPFQYVFTPQELKERENDSRILRSLDAEIPQDVRQALFDKYKVKYILADIPQVETYLEIVKQNQQELEIVYQTKDFVLLQVNSFAG